LCTGEPQLISSINDAAARLPAVARSCETTLPHHGGCRARHGTLGTPTVGRVRMPSRAGDPRSGPRSLQVSHSVEALYIRPSLRHALSASTASTGAVELYSSTPSTLYNPLQHPSGSGQVASTKLGRVHSPEILLRTCRQRWFHVLVQT
jgi:hypothetical protein